MDFFAFLQQESVVWPGTARMRTPRASVVAPPFLLMVLSSAAGPGSSMVPAPSETAPAPEPNLGSPRAGLDCSDGTFFLRSADDNLLLATGGRVHIDTYMFAGPNLSSYHKSNGSALAPQMFFRRFDLESAGIVRHHGFFWVGGNFAPTQIDANQATMSTAAVYDGFVGYQGAPHL